MGANVSGPLVKYPSRCEAARWPNCHHPFPGSIDFLPLAAWRPWTASQFSSRVAHRMGMASLRSWSTPYILRSKSGRRHTRSNSAWSADRCASSSTSTYRTTIPSVI